MRYALKGYVKINLVVITKLRTFEELKQNSQQQIMKKLLIIALVIIAFTSCKKDIVIPQIDLTNYTAVLMDDWYAAKAPLKVEYYLDMGTETVPMHFSNEMVMRWSMYQYWYTGRKMYVFTSDYNIYITK